MTNEEIIEELYYTAFTHGVIESFRQDVGLKAQTNSEKLDMVTIVEEVFNSYVKEGLINVD